MQRHATETNQILWFYSFFRFSIWKKYFQLSALPHFTLLRGPCNRGQMRERWFLIKRIFSCFFFPLCFVKSGIKWRELNRNQTIKNGGGSCALFSLAPFPIVFSFGLGSAVLSSKTRLKTHQKTPVSKASQNAYWRPKILTICTHVRSSRQNEATCADRTFSR